MRCGNGFSRVCLFIFDMQVHLQNTQVKFAYQGHRGKVKVTRVKTARVVLALREGCAVAMGEGHLQLTP